MGRRNKASSGPLLTQEDPREALNLSSKPKQNHDFSELTAVITTFLINVLPPDTRTLAPEPGEAHRGAP